MPIERGSCRFNLRAGFACRFLRFAMNDTIVNLLAENCYEIANVGVG